MLTDDCQRWERRERYRRPAYEKINPRDYEVALIPDDTTAKAFVVEHHYAQSYPAARARGGLYHRGQLVGVAVVNQPMNEKVVDPFQPWAPLVGPHLEDGTFTSGGEDNRLRLPWDPQECAELGRFVLLKEVPGNGESFFLARLFELLRSQGYRGIVSFADPVERFTLDGRKVKPGHVGYIYQATNAVLKGRSTKRTLHVLPDGRVFSPRSMQKVRAFERNWQSAAEELQRFGAPPLTERDDGRAWLATWLPRLTRRLRHPGNYRYLFGLTPEVRRRLPVSDPYPKIRA
jgi:hypothetical protein